MDATVEFFSAEQVVAGLPMAECTNLMEEALRDLAAGCIEMPLRSVMVFGERKIFGQMPSWLKRQGVLGTKVITMVPQNRARGIASHQGLILLFSADDGTPWAVVDAESVTAIRTAAVSAVATRRLARAEASCLAILGTGQQARTHLQAMLSVRPFSRIAVYGPHRERAQAYQRDMMEQLHCTVVLADSVEEACAEADVICTVSSSTTPILFSSQVKDGCHINAVGACRADERELDSALVARSRLYVDRRESAYAEAGDYLIPVSEGVISREHIVGELGDVLAGRAPGREDATQVTLFKSLGLAVEDVAAAYYLYQHRRMPRIEASF
jgi:ornithine cyclodeaminase